MSAYQVIIEQIGNFHIAQQFGRHYLYFNHPETNTNYELAVNYTGDWKKRHGSLDKWLNKIVKQHTDRFSSIQSTIKELNDELEWRTDIVDLIKEFR